MKFSVLINNYNYAKYLRECIDSVLRQTLPPHEIIVVDDGSTDDSLALLQGVYGNNPLIKIISQENSGQFAAIDAGIQAANGEVICLLDADDYYQPEYLEALAALYRDKPEIDVVFCRFTVTGNQNNGICNSIWLNPEGDYDYGQTALLTYFYFKDRSTFWVGNVTSCVSLKAGYARRARLAELGRKWDGSIQADYALLLGCSLLGARKYYFARELVAYRVHGYNYWAGIKLTARQRQANRVRYRTIFDFYKQQAGLGDCDISRLKEELKTVPYPSAGHRDVYRKLSRKFYWKDNQLNLKKGLLRRIKDLRWIFSEQK
jgi:glycosyltransferase involved in cell wall biosynthesis